MNRGNSGQVIFNSPDDYTYYLEKLAELKQEHPFDLVHYCLMDTHTHFLVKIHRDTNFSTFSKRLNLSYANYFKRNYGLIGHFWQGRFKSKLISQDSYLIECGKYIELNPVRAGIVQRPEDYRWSSYGYYAFGRDDALVSEDIFYEASGSNKSDRQKYYRDLIISTMIAEDLDTDRPAVGSSRFVYNTNRKMKYHIRHEKSPYRQSSDQK
jgi:putative transposase